MRPIALSLLAAAVLATLAACGPSTSEPAAPAAAPEPAKPVEAAAPAPKPAAPVKEIPEGACGDQSQLPADQRVANTVKWTTASEQDNFGFDVYRGESEKGDFAKLTKDPILGAGTSDETHQYEFRDDTIDPCKPYWYYVEGISTKGTHEKFTPTFRASPKHRPVGSPPATAEPAAPAKE